MLYLLSMSAVVKWPNSLHISAKLRKPSLQLLCTSLSVLAATGKTSVDRKCCSSKRIKWHTAHSTKKSKQMKTYTAAATVEYEEFGFHATSLTGNSNFNVLIQRPVDTSHNLTEQSCEPVWYNSIDTVGCHSTHYTSFWGQFYGSDDPTNSVTALKDNG